MIPFFCIFHILKQIKYEIYKPNNLFNFFNIFNKKLLKRSIVFNLHSTIALIASNYFLKHVTSSTNMVYVINLPFDILDN